MTNSLLLSIDYSYTSFKYILHDMMLIRLQTRKVGHDLDLKISFQVIFHTEIYLIMNLMHLVSQ